MKKLFLLLLIVPVLGFGQGEQRYADGTATDQDGNTFEWINYGTQDWAIENAEVVTYRDGTPIPNVQGDSESNFWYTMEGAWCYLNNDPNEGKLYNWYAVGGLHDRDENTPNKEFAPQGWRVPTEADWTTFVEYLIANGYNHDGTTTENKIAKAVASTTGWSHCNVNGGPGDNQSTNNLSGFNSLPGGVFIRNKFYSEWAMFWSSTIDDLSSRGTDIYAWERRIGDEESGFVSGSSSIDFAMAVRFVRDASTASTNDYSNAITIYPNPTTSIVTLQGDNEYDIEVYTLQGKKVMALTGNTIDMSHLSSATYIVKALDKVENEEVSYKVVKN